MSDSDGHNDASSNSGDDVEEHEFISKITAAIAPTAFDQYFTQMSLRSQTSANIFSSLVPPLSPEEYANYTATIQPPPCSALLKEPMRSSVFKRMIVELNEGFNIIGYGYGSKRRLLNGFAREYCAKRGHVAIANGFQPSFTFKEFLSSIGNLTGLADSSLGSSIEAQSKRINNFFLSFKRCIYLIIHNIDSPQFRNLKARSCLSLLALNPRIHLIASIDHINAPTLWTSSEISARKDADLTDIRGFAWLWHDLTTLQPYDFELSHADRSSISGASGAGRKATRDAAHAAAKSAISETAALHVLAAVTQRAKKFFVLMAQRQLDAIEDDAATDMQEFAVSYETLFSAARDEFIANNDVAFRAVLAEFKDHYLIVGAETLWIPMRKEILKSLVGKISVD